MELLVEGSQLDIQNCTIISDLPSTLIGVTGQARLTVLPGQSITDANRYSFSIQPCIPMELWGRNSFVRVRYRVKKNNGEDFAEKEQVSCGCRDGIERVGEGMSE